MMHGQTKIKSKIFDLHFFRITPEMRRNFTAFISNFLQTTDVCDC